MIIETKDITKKFGGLLALQKVSFVIYSNEILGLIGPNGAGKTTLFNTMTGFLKPEEGSILFEGKDVVGKRPFDICRLGISRTFQIVKPFSNITVLQNAMVGSFSLTNSSREAREIALEQIHFVGLYDKRNTLANALTINQRKRLEIARALCTNPKLLLLDEVMGGLTPSEVHDMLKLIIKIRESGITLFIIEHIMSAIMNLCDRIIVLHHGQKIAEGKPNDVGANPQVIQAYLGREYVVT